MSIDAYLAETRLRREATRTIIAYAGHIRAYMHSLSRLYANALTLVAFRDYLRARSIKSRDFRSVYVEWSIAESRDRIEHATAELSELFSFWVTNVSVMCNSLRVGDDTLLDGVIEFPRDRALEDLPPLMKCNVNEDNYDEKSAYAEVETLVNRVQALSGPIRTFIDKFVTDETNSSHVYRLMTDYFLQTADVARYKRSAHRITIFRRDENLSTYLPPGLPEFGDSIGHLEDVPKFTAMCKFCKRMGETDALG